MDSRALTRIQTLLLIIIIAFAGIGGSVAYVLLKGPAQPRSDVIIGVVTDLDTTTGKGVLQGVILAAEQLNVEGGILGRNVTVVSEDDDSYTPPYDVSVAVNALTKLITVDKADYIITGGGIVSIITPYQDVSAEHKKILISVNTALDNLTQRVLDNYERYKYFFKVWSTNSTTISNGMLGDIMTVGRYTGFTKVALLFNDVTATAKALMNSLKTSLPQNGYEVVYGNFYAQGTTDFSSYFAAIEASGAEILVPWLSSGEQLSAAFVKEWYTRTSPVVLWGIIGGAYEQDFWELTEGKCDTVSFSGAPIVSGYPLTNKTLPTREAYLQRWGEAISGIFASAYDTLRTILPDAIKRAGTFETEAVIKSLENTNIETSMARHFMFTCSHDVMVGGTLNEPSSDYLVMFTFQWQNGTQVPVKPESVMKESGATYKYPPWQGPWSSKQPSE